MSKLSVNIKNIWCNVDKTRIERIVKCEILRIILQQTGRRFIPATVSNRHIHLSRQDAEVLFGSSSELTCIHSLSQPGQFACEEFVSLVGPKGSIEKIRVLGPERETTQVEISVTDSYKLGIQSVVKMSGDLNGTPGGKRIGPCGEIDIRKGVIVAARHLHMSNKQAEAYFLRDGDIVKLEFSGIRRIVFDNVLVRVGYSHEMELHLDMDEANAALIKNGDYMEIID